VTLATPNIHEAMGFCSDRATDRTPAAVAGHLATVWDCSVAVTRGDRPVVVAEPGMTPDRCREVACRPVTGDPCGAGDWFAASATWALAAGASIDDAVRSGCEAAAGWIERPAEAPARRRVIATSGCFDVLHAGHIALLEHARSLGDRLIVLLNSDASVRRLKGNGRPVNSQDERRVLLAALAAVDEVRVFDGLTPCDALRAIRPHVFVKGADYADVALPERELVAEWGGTVAFAPLVPGRSTTRVIELAARLAG
jgi:rfaE bifunctional protein nucleotidyltransferase chain/domain